MRFDEAYERIIENVFDRVPRAYMDIGHDKGRPASDVVLWWMSRGSLEVHYVELEWHNDDHYTFFQDDESILVQGRIDKHTRKISMIKRDVSPSYFDRIKGIAIADLSESYPGYQIWVFEPYNVYQALTEGVFKGASDAEVGDRKRALNKMNAEAMRSMIDAVYKDSVEKYGDRVRLKLWRSFVIERGDMFISVESDTIRGEPVIRTAAHKLDGTSDTEIDYEVDHAINTISVYMSPKWRSLRPSETSEQRINTSLGKEAQNRSNEQ